MDIDYAAWNPFSNVIVIIRDQGVLSESRSKKEILNKALRGRLARVWHLRRAEKCRDTKMPGRMHQISSST